MSSHAGRSLKRKIDECQDDENDGGPTVKEAKVDQTSEEVPVNENALTLLRLSPDDWVCTSATNTQDDNEKTTVEDYAEGGLVSKGTLWTGKDIRQQNLELSKVSLVCRRFPNGSHSDCETQTYHFVPNPTSDTLKTSDTSHLKTTYKEGAVDKSHDDHVRVCCVRDCGSQSYEKDSATTYYRLPFSSSERLLWGEILGVDICNAPADTLQEICSKHFVTSKSTSVTTNSCPEPKSTQVPKSRTRKKRTCDILIAEEAEKVKESMVTGRAKRTPKPNRNYDWAELIPLIKTETDDFERIERAAPKALSKHHYTSGRRRKQLLDEVKTEGRESDNSYLELHADYMDETEVPELETEDYGVNISLPSLPRPPPPKPKGRPHRILDTCTQTDGGLCTSREPLREVKVQCNLTAEPLVCCSSCSNIDWMSLEEQLISCVPVAEEDLCNSVVAECLKKVVSSIKKPSHASNVLKILSGIERDALESGKDIVLVSSQDEFEEVEIENVIHQEEAPITGVREITPNLWNKRAKFLKEIKIKNEQMMVDDPDSLGLQEATERDDEEFHPEYSALEEDEDDPDEMDDDDDWDIRKEDALGAHVVKKKKARQKLKKDMKGAAAEVCCRYCRKPFLSVDQCNAHHCKSHQNDKNRKFPCNKCGRSFAQKISLQYHNVYIHDGERKAACPHCPYRAPDKAKLSLHLRKHSKARPYVCEICNASFKFRSTYKTHVARHTNSGSYICYHCNKAFVRVSELEEHIQIHSNDRPFVCSQCGMSFKQRKRLRVHLRAVHYQDKRFVCSICGSTFINNWNLRAHLRTHIHINGNYTHICIHCGSTFRGKAGLAAHIRMRHPMMILKVDDDDDEVAIEHILDPTPPTNPLEIRMIEIEVFSCNLCGALFESIDLLTNHTTTEHEVYVY